MKEMRWLRNTELGDNEKTHPLLDGLFCGDSWTRTNDPIDVNDVLYRLSHATLYVNRFLSYHVRVTFADAHRIGRAICLGSTVLPGTMVAIGLPSGPTD